MWRLRTTFGLSLLALLLGVAGTAWLSTPGGSRDAFARASQAGHRGVRKHRAAVAARPAMRAALQATPAAVIAPSAPPRTLVPLSMPADSSLRWEVLRGHLDGSAVVHLTLDPTGHVGAAELVRGSGDPVLDAYALRSVRRWRFAPPGDRGGVSSGDLSMRFSSAAARASGAP